MLLAMGRMTAIEKIRDLGERPLMADSGGVASNRSYRPFSGATLKELRRVRRLPLIAPNYLLGFEELRIEHHQHIWKFTKDGRETA